jgi:hypothetical protein
MPQSKLPPFYYMKATEEGGELSSELHLHLDQTYQYMEKNLSSSGYVFPTVTAAQLAGDFLANAANGTMWYVSDAPAKQKLKIKMDGALETVQLV